MGLTMPVDRCPAIHPRRGGQCVRNKGHEEAYHKMEEVTPRDQTHRHTNVWLWPDEEGPHAKPSTI